MKITNQQLRRIIKEELENLAEQTDPRAALIGAVDAALSEIDMDPDLRMEIAKTLGDSVADKFLFGFEAKQKDVHRNAQLSGLTQKD